MDEHSTRPRDGDINSIVPRTRQMLAGAMGIARHALTVADLLRRDNDQASETVEVPASRPDTSEHSVDVGTPAPSEAPSSGNRTPQRLREIDRIRTDCDNIQQDLDASNAIADSLRARNRAYEVENELARADATGLPRKEPRSKATASSSFFKVLMVVFVLYSIWWVSSPDMQYTRRRRNEVLFGM